MAKANSVLIAAMRRAANKIVKEDNYQWGHMGHCNCGHLAQELSDLSPSEIHKIAMQRSGDWNDQCKDYCETSQMPIDILISELLSKGLSIEELMNLEKLGDQQVLERLPQEKKYLERNNKFHVALYLVTWAEMLEEKFIRESNIDSISKDLLKEELICQ